MKTILPKMGRPSLTGLSVKYTSRRQYNRERYQRIIKPKSWGNTSVLFMMRLLNHETPTQFKDE